MTRSCMAAFIAIIPSFGLASVGGEDVGKLVEKELPIPGQVFAVDGHTAFLILPKQEDRADLTPWVWYAPTLPGLPEEHERWMFDRFLKAGMAIAGIDVGESYGSPEGCAAYSALYKELVEKRGLAPKACLLARSRGGLMLYRWACDHPDAVACIAGIYPVCNLLSYPGLATACGAYKLSEADMASKLSQYNPIDRLSPLAKASVPIFHIHGDDDTTVPLEDNSGELVNRYRALGGNAELVIAKGQGHNMWQGFFQCQELVDFVIANKSGPISNVHAVEPLASDASGMAVALTGSEQEPIMKSEDLVFLQDIAGAVVEASRVVPGAKVGEIGPNTTGGVFIRPGGRACYPAFWIRDYAMSLESGLISREEQRHALLLTASNQPDETRTLRSGAVVPAGSIADHITFDGKPIFFPGTLDDYEGQGGGQWGTLPVLDDHFFFIHIAAEYVRLSGDADILNLVVNGKSLMIRLEAAFRMPPSREDSGLVYAEADRRGVTFGFVDAVTHTGDLLFCSLLKRRAALEMAELLEKRGDLDAAHGYRDTAEKLRHALPSFATKQGLLRASTGVSAQPDVWGSAFAVYTDALDEPLQSGVCNALATYYLQGQLAWRGNIRHVPVSEDFSATSAWESAASPKNRYQNGAYWGTPTGWVCYAIAQVNPDAARRLAAEYIQELREGDFRKGPEFGSPWECMHPDGGHRQNPVYMTSVTCPLAAFRRLAP